MWTKHVILANGFPVKVYVNQGNSKVFIFPLFGRCFGLISNTNALDFAVTFLVARSNNVISMDSYNSSLEDTTPTYIDKIAI